MLKIKSLREEVAAAGLFERCEGRSWGKLAFLMSIFGGLLAAHALLPFWASVLLVPVTAVFCAVGAMLGHEGSHRGLSSAPWRNRLMFNLTFPTLGGVSGLYWHWKHDVQHHAHPNVIDLDPDILLWPMAASAVEYRRSSNARQWFQRNHQELFFWPLCALLVWSMRGSTIAFLYRYARDRGMDRAWRTDVFCLTIHVLAWVIVPAFFFGPWAVALYAAIWTVVGLALSLVFAPAHMGLPVVTDTKDIWRLQFETTRNLTMPRWLSFFFIGLDYQLEHHLFPKIPHQRLGEASVITRAWAARNGVPYQEIPYWDGVKDVTRFMRDCWDQEPEDMVQLRPVDEAAAEPEGDVAACNSGDATSPPQAALPLAQ